jgi:hypothetical protein
MLLAIPLSSVSHKPADVVAVLVTSGRSACRVVSVPMTMTYIILIVKPTKAACYVERHRLTQGRFIVHAGSWSAARKRFMGFSAVDTA